MGERSGLKKTELCTNYSGVLVIWLSHKNIMVATTGVVCCINLFSYMGDLLASYVHCCVVRPSLVTKPPPPASARASCNGPVNWNVMHWTLLQHPRYIFHQCQPESKLLYTREVWEINESLVMIKETVFHVKKHWLVDITFLWGLKQSVFVILLVENSFSSLNIKWKFD